MSEEDKVRGTITSHHHHHHPDQPQYGTFQGVPNYPPPRPPVGFPQPVPPPGAADPSSAPQYYAHGYQTVPGYAVAEGRPARVPRLPCCGFGCGWFLFIIGFFLAAIPWYVGAILILFGRVDHREKPGYVACTIAAILGTIAIVLGVTKGTHVW